MTLCVGSPPVMTTYSVIVQSYNGADDGDSQPVCKAVIIAVLSQSCDHLAIKLQLQWLQLPMAMITICTFLCPLPTNKINGEVAPATFPPTNPGFKVLQSASKSPASTFCSAHLWHLLNSSLCGTRRQHQILVCSILHRTGQL